MNDVREEGEGWVVERPVMVKGNVKMGSRMKEAKI